MTKVGDARGHSPPIQLLFAGCFVRGGARLLDCRRRSPLVGDDLA